MARQVLDNGVVLPSEYSDDWYDDMTSNLTKLDEVIGSDAEKLSASDVGEAAISNDYDDLDDKPEYNILRRASVTLTAGGTGNYTDLDSDSKIKAGDYVLDASNKLYSITAIDAANSTYTVSAAALFTVTDKAELGAAALSNDYDDLSNLPGYGILRFCSTAITDNSSVPFANISSVSKIAAGDFLLDTAAKLYTVSAIDTVNQTVSVTTPLTQLAQDSDVVHKSGNETVGDAKTFSSDLTVANTDTTSNTPNLNLRNYKADRGTTDTAVQAISFLDKNAKALTSIESRRISNGNTATNILCYNTDDSNNTVSGGIAIIKGKNDTSFAPNANNTVTCGRPLAKWSDVQTYLVNGLTPSSLSLPGGTSIDISGYITDFSGGNNLYTAPVNGIIAVDISGTNRYVLYNNNLSIGDHLTGSNFRRAGIIQVRKNDAVIIQSDGGTLNYAKFYPCLGNV